MGVIDVELNAQSEIKVEKASWDEVEQIKTTAFFKPEIGKSYKIKFASCELVRKSFHKNQEAKLTVAFSIKQIDGRDCNLKWDTGSLKIIKSVKPYKDRINQVLWLVKQELNGNKTSYVFEVLDDEVEAFLS